jgi:hypothetical protein
MRPWMLVGLLACGTKGPDIADTSVPTPSTTTSPTGTPGGTTATGSTPAGATPTGTTGTGTTPTGTTPTGTTPTGTTGTGTTPTGTTPTGTTPGETGDTGDVDDADGDGFLAPEDCDDRDRGTFPGALELCDGKDNDCDGVIDMGAMALALDGDDQLSTDGPTDRVAITGAMTLEFWLETDRLDQELMTFGDPLVAPYWNLAVNELGQVHFEAESSRRIVSVPSNERFSAGRWTHVALTVAFDPMEDDTGLVFPPPASFRVYIDAIAHSPYVVPATFFTDEAGVPGPFTWLLGGPVDAPFTGRIDELRVWDHWRDRLQIEADRCRPLRGDEPGLVAYYPFEAGTDDATAGGLHLLTSAGAPSIEPR